MVTIGSHQVTPALLSLFDLSRPTMPSAFHVLEGITRGEILLDDPDRPAWAAVHEATYGTLYIGGNMDADLLSSLVDRIRRGGEVGIGCWLDDPLNDMLPPNPDYDGRTLYFTERTRSVDERRVPLPRGYSLAARDRSFLRQSFDYESTLASFRTEENILQQTLGVVILCGRKVVCEAATGAPTHGRIEVGVTTDASHRRLGLATIACAHLIGMCEAQGYATWWDCAKQNTSSAALARKLGYVNEREYRFVWWARHKPAGGTASADGKKIGNG